MRDRETGRQREIYVRIYMYMYVYMRGTQREKGKKGFILAHASAKSRGSGCTGSRDSSSDPRTGSLFTPQLCSSLL